MAEPNSVWTVDRLAPGTCLFWEGDHFDELSNPIEIRSCSKIEDVRQLLGWAEVGSSAGYVAYEAAPAFDSALIGFPPSGELAWFARYEGSRSFSSIAPTQFCSISDVELELTREQYQAKFNEIKRRIRDGDTYQVNLTFRVRARAENLDWIAWLLCDQPAEYGAIIHTGKRLIVSLSPELFFEKSGDFIQCKPMKGTRPISSDPEELRQNPKDRAENLMIVDMIRNDLGHLCKPGSIDVPALFEVQAHRTVWQMTSTVTGILERPGVFDALFPCASVVGAPKVITSAHIAELEESPRSAYCGAIGRFFDSDNARFSVGIRTLTIDPETLDFEYGIGSGVVWDSSADDEFDECLVKLQALKQPELGLTETLYWCPESGYRNLDRHLDRLARSADELGFAFTKEVPEVAANTPQRVRWLLDRAGQISVTSVDYIAPTQPMGFVLDSVPVSSNDFRLKHKTTARSIYENAELRHGNGMAVLLQNERGELTEFTRANLMVEIDGKRLTPPLSSGLLPGIQREIELESGCEEKILFPTDLSRAERVWCLSSLHGRIEVSKVGT